MRLWLRKYTLRLNDNHNVMDLFYLKKRAVVWTDAIQFLLMFGAIFAVIVLGIVNLAYPLEMFSIADEGQRLVLFE